MFYSESKKNIFLEKWVVEPPNVPLFNPRLSLYALNDSRRARQRVTVQDKRAGNDIKMALKWHRIWTLKSLGMTEFNSDSHRGYPCRHVTSCSVTCDILWRFCVTWQSASQILPNITKFEELRKCFWKYVGTILRVKWPRHPYHF